MHRKTWIKIGLCVLAALLIALLIWRCGVEPEPPAPTGQTDNISETSDPSPSQTEPSQETVEPTAQTTEPLETQRPQETQPAVQATEPPGAQRPQKAVQPAIRATEPPETQPPVQTAEPPETQHQHSWQAVSQTLHHEAEYKEVSHPEKWEEVWVVDRPAKADTIELVPIYATRDIYITIDIRTGEEFRSSQWEEHYQKCQELGRGNYRVGASTEQYISGYEEVSLGDGWPEEGHMERKLVQAAYTESVLVRDAWDETVTRYVCRDCGQEKP